MKKQVKKPLSQKEKVLKYLVKQGKKGATNFQMMMSLRMCDVRKRITEINRDADCKYQIDTEWIEGNGPRYKRYYAVRISK